MTRDRDPILRYGGMYALALEYRGTSNNSAIRRLLHFAVSDASDDVRRALILLRLQKSFPFCRSHTTLTFVMARGNLLCWNRVKRGLEPGAGDFVRQLVALMQATGASPCCFQVRMPKVDIVSDAKPPAPSRQQRKTQTRSELPAVAPAPHVRSSFYSRASGGLGQKMAVYLLIITVTICMLAVLAGRMKKLRAKFNRIHEIWAEWNQHLYLECHHPTPESLIWSYFPSKFNQQQTWMIKLLLVVALAALVAASSGSSGSTSEVEYEEDLMLERDVALGFITIALLLPHRRKPFQKGDALIGSIRGKSTVKKDYTIPAGAVFYVLNANEDEKLEIFGLLDTSSGFDATTAMIIKLISERALSERARLHNGVSWTACMPKRLMEKLEEKVHIDGSRLTACMLKRLMEKLEEKGWHQLHLQDNHNHKKNAVNQQKSQGLDGFADKVEESAADQDDGQWNFASWDTVIQTDAGGKPSRDAQEGFGLPFAHSRDLVILAENVRTSCHQRVFIEHPRAPWRGSKI
ncbi:hypothetical protein SELMODRAFT_412321 [Selaginella moellendorffii]|uniref:Uncharacterized protein n=1 Tax=Selaginella moellendorffii TaxID=88036 RepID=D8RKS4_SELML|nr:hypothetical protein SELMODRAFT_412321 [Selaginella moellendorffii]